MWKLKYSSLPRKFIQHSSCCNRGFADALDLVDKRIEEIRIVVCGAGTVGIGCARLLIQLGVKSENLLMYDINGLLHQDRDDLSEYQRPFVVKSSALTLDKGLRVRMYSSELLREEF